jgi:ferredoxin
MHVEIDLAKCAGYGNCVEAAPDVFEMSDVADVAEVIWAEPTEGMREAVRKAARVCPTQAVVIVE